MTGISLLAVNVDTYKGFKPNQAYATENNYSSKENNNGTKTEFGRTENGRQVNLDSQVEKVAGGFEFTEGPVWHPDGFLLFSDIPANTIYKWQAGQKTEIFRQPSGNANGNILDRSGRLGNWTEKIIP